MLNTVTLHTRLDHRMHVNTDEYDERTVTSLCSDVHCSTYCSTLPNTNTTHTHRTFRMFPDSVYSFDKHISQIKYTHIKIYTQILQNTHTIHCEHV